MKLWRRLTLIWRVVRYSGEIEALVAEQLKMGQYVIAELQKPKAERDDPLRELVVREQLARLLLKSAAVYKEIAETAWDEDQFLYYTTGIETE